MTLTAFLANNFWVYTFIAIPLLLYSNRQETNPPALYFFLLFVLPVATIAIPGAGLVNFFFELTHARILSLFILLPAFFVLNHQGNNPAFGRLGPDKVLTAFLLLTTLLQLRDGNFTNTLRAAFYLFTDVFLPYFVVSRSLKRVQEFRDALLSFVLAIMVVAALAAFEFYKHWMLYSAWVSLFKLKAETTYLDRNGMLRATVTAGQAIALGYLMVVGFGFYLFISQSIRNKLIRKLGLLLVLVGLIASLSRGPWLGAVLLLVLFIATGRNPVPRLMSMALATILALSIVSILPEGQRVINLLPFIGNTEKENIDYREQLITNSMIVIKRNFWFGSIDPLDTPEMEAMRQGQGIIDVVNSYIGIALENGVVGLGLFVSFFALTLFGIHRAMRLIPDKDSEEHLLGRVLLATLLAILFIIFTVSSITVIPIVYWSVAGLGVAYAQMVRRNYA